MNVQVVCTLDGELVWISDPIDGAHHDVFCLDESGVLQMLDPRDWTGDKGYVGRDMITPVKKVNGGEPVLQVGEAMQQQYGSMWVSAVGKPGPSLEDLQQHIDEWTKSRLVRRRLLDEQGRGR